MLLLCGRPKPTTLLRMHNFTLAFASPTATPHLTYRHHAQTCHQTTLTRSTFTPRTNLHTSCAPRAHAARPQTSFTTATASGDIVIAGGSGFVGTRLAKALLARGESVTILTRDPRAHTLPAAANAVAWSSDAADAPTLQEALSGARAVINLCGQPIATRWTAATRDAIVQSRLQSTRALVSALTALRKEDRPRVLVSTSGVGYYGFAMPYDVRVDEASDPGSDFLADLCCRWEDCAGKAGAQDVRTVSLRLGIVLGGEGGALAKMIPAFQMFVGGPLGSGRQWVSWVHADDVVAAFLQAIDNDTMQGAYNCTAPNSVTMSAFCSALGGALKRPSLLAVPGVVLKLALGEASCVLLEGQNVIPKRLTQAGFKFQYEDIDSAMRAVAQEL